MIISIISRILPEIKQSEISGTEYYLSLLNFGIIFFI